MARTLGVMKARAIEFVSSTADAILVQGTLVGATHRLEDTRTFAENCSTPAHGESATVAHMCRLFVE